MSALLNQLDGWSENWWTYVMHASWQAAVLGLVLLGVLRLGRRWPSPLRYGILLIALIKFVCPPWLPAPTGLFSRVGPMIVQAPARRGNDPFFAAQAPALRLEDPVPLREPRSGAAPSDARVIPAGQAPIPAAGQSPDAPLSPAADWVPRRRLLNDSGPAAPGQLHSAASTRRPGWKAVLMVVHATGALLLLSWTAWQVVLLSYRVRQAARPGPLPLEKFMQLRRALRMGRGARLLVSPRVASPVAFGVVRPTVLLPASLATRLSEPDLETVLAHELIHLRRGDAWIHWAQHIICIAWWFHPVAWLVGRTLRKVREDCCDDLLLARNIATPEAYCQTLLRVATAVAARPRLRMTMEMARGLHPIGHRLMRIMDNALGRSARLSAAALAALVLLAAVTLPGVDATRSAAAPTEGPAQKTSPDKRPDSRKQPRQADPAKTFASKSSDRATAAAEAEAEVRGTVYDPQGKPAAGAAVLLLGGSYDEPPQVLAESTSDAEGRFAFAGLPHDELFAPAVRQPQLLARDDQRRIGWSNPAGRRRGPPYVVELLNVSAAKGRVVDSAGQPIPGARLKPMHLKASPARERNFNMVELPSQWGSDFEAATAEDGSFTIPGLPSTGGLIAEVQADGYARPRLIWETPTVATIRLDKAGSISGSLVPPEGVELPPALKLVVRMQLDPAAFKTADVAMNFFENVGIERDGTFRLSGLPAGRYDIQPQVDYATKLYAQPVMAVEVQAGGEVSGISIHLLPCIEVTGRVLDEEDQPIEGVQIGICNITGERHLLTRHYVTTDADGRYVGYAQPGVISARVTAVPGDFLPPGEEEAGAGPETPADSPDVPIHLEPIRLQQAQRLPVEVVDAAGQPVADAEVRLVRPPLLSSSFNNSARTDAEGKLTLGQLDPTDTLPLRARTGTAATDGALIVVPSEVKGAARLVVSERSAFRLRGRVVDAGGAAISRAAVTLWWGRNYASQRTGLSGLSSALDHLVSGADGTFESRALWPGDRYHIVVDADGYGQFESAQLVGTAGETHDFSDIVLTPTGRFVEGRVVHNGAPVAGVHVFNSGDAAGPLHTTTDGQGRFRLTGFFPGEAYIFAQHDGYWFAGLRVPTNSSDITLELARKDQSPMQREAIETGAFAQDRRLARQWLERLWPINKQDPNRKLWDGWSAMRLLVSMARIDPAKGLAWSNEAGGRAPDWVRPIVAESVASNPDEVLPLLVDAGSQVASHTLINLARQLSERDPATALRYVEEAMVRSRTLDQPYRAYSMANAAGLAIRLGQEESGRAALAEAAEMAAKLGSDDLQAYVRGGVAAALAPYDLQQALALVEPIDEPAGRERYLGNIAVAIAAQDPDKALDVVREFPERSSQLNQVRMRIAYALAQRRPAEAVAMVEGIEGLESAKTKAEAFGWLAVAVEPSDRLLAWSLIDRSLEIYRTEQEDFSRWSNYGGPSTFAAHVACQAHQVGYPDMPGAVYQVMAARPTVNNGLKSQLDLLDCRVTTARLLALVDRRTARELLEQVESRRDLLGTGGVGTIDRGEWLQAWALVDPQRAAQLFEEELPAALRETTDRRLRQLMSMVELLTIPTFERPAYMYPSGAIWFPSQEP